MIFYILIKVTINKILNSRRVIVRFGSLFSLTGSQKFLVVEFFAGLCHVLQQLAGSEGDPVGLLEPSHVVDKDLSSHGVDISEGNQNQLWKGSAPSAYLNGPPENGGNPRPKTAPMSPSIGVARMPSW